VDRVERRTGTQGPYARVTVSMEGGEERRVFFAPTDEAEEEGLPCLLKFVERGIVREGSRLLFHRPPDENEWFRWRGYRDRYGLWKKGPPVSLDVGRLVPVYEAVPFCRLKGFISGRLGIEEVTSERSIMGVVRHRILQRHWRLLWGGLSSGQGPEQALKVARIGTEDFIDTLSRELKLPGLSEEAATTLSTCEEVSHDIIEWTGGEGYFCSEYNMMSPRLGLVGRADFIGIRKGGDRNGRIIEYKITDHTDRFQRKTSWGASRALLQAATYSKVFQEALGLPRVTAEVWVFDKWSGGRAYQHVCDEGNLEDQLRRALWARDEYLFSVSSSRPALGEYGKSRCRSCSFRDICKVLNGYEPDPALNRVRDALDIESAAAWRSLESVEDLVEEGVVVPENDIVEYDEDSLTVRIRGDWGRISASPGGFVRFSPPQATHGWGFGIVQDIDGDLLRIRLRDPLTPSVLEEGKLRLDFSVPLDFSRRAKMAITALEIPEALSREEEVISNLRELRRAVESAASVESAMVDQRLMGLNESQQRAAQRMLASKLTVIHGPFGSGKTTVIARAALQLARAGKRILVTSYTNNAVDNALGMIADLAKKEGVRIGLVRVATAERARKKDGVVVVDPRHFSGEDISLLRGARVVGSTLISCLSNAFQDAFMEKSGYVRLRYIPFDLCIVDEASQSILPYALIPCLLSRRWVLVGDHKQLEPLVVDRRAARDLNSWFDMAAKDLEEVGGMVMLDVQYRCPHEVGSYLSKQFYESKLRNDEVGRGEHDHAPVHMDPVAGAKRINQKLSAAGIGASITPQGLATIMDPRKHLIFIDTEGRSPERGGRSKSNPGEAIVVSELLTTLKGATEDILFLSPYHAQNSLLKRMTSGEVRMGTVDSYQGRQADVVILSLVRSNRNGLLGFLRNVRRLNVAMSRCMKKLIVISDSATIRMNRADLRAREALMYYIHTARKLGGYVSLAPEKKVSRDREKRRALALRPSLGKRSSGDATPDGD